MVDSITIDQGKANSATVIVVNVKGEPHEKISLNIKINQMIPVSNCEFNMEVKDVNVPWSHNKLTVEAFHVEDMTMAVKFFL